MDTICKHLRVRIVSRYEGAQYVECEECRQVFESGELHDMQNDVKEEAGEDE